MHETKLRREKELALHEKSCNAEVVRLADALPQYGLLETLREQYAKEQKMQKKLQKELDKRKKRMDDLAEQREEARQLQEKFAASPGRMEGLKLREEQLASLNRDLEKIGRASCRERV